MQRVKISKFGASVIVHVYKIYNLAPEEDKKKIESIHVLLFLCVSLHW